MVSVSPSSCQSKSQIYFGQQPRKAYATATAVKKITSFEKTAATKPPMAPHLRTIEIPSVTFNVAGSFSLSNDLMETTFLDRPDQQAKFHAVDQQEKRIPSEIDKNSFIITSSSIQSTTPLYKSILKKSSTSSMQSISSISSSNISNTSNTTTYAKKIQFNPESLESILHFYASDPPDQSTKTDIIYLSDIVSTIAKSVSSALLIPRYWSISGLSQLSHASQARSFYVLLDSVTLSQNILKLSILVRNVAFEKNVMMRSSWNGWKQWTDKPALFTHTVSNSLSATGGQGVDRFLICLDLENEIGEGDQFAEFEFAVYYRVSGEEHWDNNNGINHKVSLSRTAPITSLGLDLLKDENEVKNNQQSRKKKPRGNFPSMNSNLFFFNDDPPSMHMQHRQHAHPFPVNHQAFNTPKNQITTGTERPLSPFPSSLKFKSTLLQNFYSILPSSRNMSDYGGNIEMSQRLQPRRVTLLPSSF